MRIESVELVALPNAPAWQEKVYRAHLDTGEDMDLFQQHWDVPLPPESLVGLTVEEARKRRNDRMFAIASGLSEAGRTFPGSIMGTTVEVVRRGLFGDPLQLRLRGFMLSVRNRQALFLAVTVKV